MEPVDIFYTKPRAGLNKMAPPCFQKPESKKNKINPGSTDLVLFI